MKPRANVAKPSIDRLLDSLMESTLKMPVDTRVRVRQRLVPAMPGLMQHPRLDSACRPLGSALLVTVLSLSAVSSPLLLNV